MAARPTRARKKASAVRRAASKQARRASGKPKATKRKATKRKSRTTKRKTKATKTNAIKTKGRRKASSTKRPRTTASAAIETLSSAESAGGPLILLPAEIAEHWRGIVPPRGAKVPAGWSWGQRGGPVCDYDRACKGGSGRAGRTSWLDVGDGTGLVLDEPLMTVWIPTSEGGVVARGPDISDGDADALRQLLPSTGFKVIAKKLELKDGLLFAFDAAAEGASEPDAIDADDRVLVGDPGPGKYEVALASKAGNDFIRFVGSGRRPARAKPNAAATKSGEPSHATPKAPRQWTTRWVKRDELPAGPKPPSGLDYACAILDTKGAFVGLLGDSVRTRHAVRFDGRRRRKLSSEPGHYTGLALAEDEKTVFVPRFDGKVFAIDALADPKAQPAVRLVFESDLELWNIAVMAGDYLVLASEENVHLLSPKGAGYQLVRSISVKPISLPSLDAFGGGRWLLVGRTPQLFLFALVNGDLLLVETFVQHERGIAVYNGVPFIYPSGTGLEEILDLDAVYATLST